MKSKERIEGRIIYLNKIKGAQWRIRILNKALFFTEEEIEKTLKDMIELKNYRAMKELIWVLE